VASDAQESSTATVGSSATARQMYVGGGWVDAAEGGTYEVLSPATAGTLATVPSAGAADVDAAVKAARDALAGPWGQTFPAGRAQVLQRLAQLVMENADELAALESGNVGKPIKEAVALDIPSAAGTLDYYAGWANKSYGQTIPHSMMPVLNYTVREPVGVVAAIVPWNFPLVIALWKVAPALATGNTVIVKPSTQTPLSMLRFCELAEAAGVPPGALNVVTGGGGEVGEALARHPGVNKIAFTGSTEVGRRIMELAAPTLKKLTLECGGKSPNIVFADADMDRAVDATLFGIFANQGEVCAAGSRLLVQSSVHDEFVERLVARARELRVGDPASPETDLGPLISASHLEKVERLVGTGVEAGAKLLVGGAATQIDGLGGAFYQPTILDEVDNSMEVAQEEIFGPVLATITFEDESDAVRIANDTMYGLIANVHTESLRRAHAVAAQLACGTVFVNLPPIPFVEAPIGGYKQTGLGKELGPHSIDEYLLTKSVVVDMTPPGQHFRWFGAAPPA
jgi:acyl-CoA reductase-like NAD-dependent aldehyde dehydrogenase